MRTCVYRSASIGLFLTVFSALWGCELIVPKLEAQKNTDTDTQLDPQTAARNDCVANGGYWYDPADVNVATAADVAALTPVCNDIATLGCEGKTELPWLVLENNTLATESVSTDYLANVSDDGETPPPLMGTQIISTIRCFRSAVNLYLHHNRIEKADLSNNDRLAEIILYNNNLTEVYVPRGENVGALLIAGNALTSIDLSGMPNLTVIFIDNNQLTSLDVSAQTRLVTLEISNNPIEEPLDLASNGAIETIWATATPITALNLPTNARFLTELHVSQTEISQLDVSGATNLETLEAFSTNISNIVLDGPGASLERLDVSETSISTLDLRANPSITYLDAIACTNLAEILLPTDASSLRTVQLENTHLETFDIANADNIEDFTLSGSTSALTGLDFSGKAALRRVYMYGCNFSDPLDLSDATVLEELYVADADLSAVFIPASEFLESIQLQSNRLTELTSPVLPALIYADLSFNRFSYPVNGEPLDLSVWPAVQVIYLRDDSLGATLSLSAESIRFSDNFLAAPYTTGDDYRLAVSEEQWATRQDALQSWTYNTVEEYGSPSAQ